MTKQTIIEKPWGYEEIWCQTPYYVGKIISINKGCKLSLQYHKFKVESIRILKGIIKLHLKENGINKSVIMNPGDTYYIPNGLIHRFEAIEAAEVLEASTIELDDVIRIEDDYNRNIELPKIVENNKMLKDEMLIIGKTAIKIKNIKE